MYSRELSDWLKLVFIEFTNELADWLVNYNIIQCIQLQSVVQQVLHSN